MDAKEVFIVSGTAPDVTYARAAAWQGLTQGLGPEPPEQWVLQQSTFTPGELTSGEFCVQYSIQFVHDPEEVAA